MLTVTPADIMRCAARPEGLDDMAFINRRNIARAHVKEIATQPTPEDIAEAVEMMADYFGIETDEAELVTILTLYPQARIGLVEWGATDTVVRGQIASAYSDHYLGCDWPTYGDDVDIAAFTAVLKSQIERVKVPEQRRPTVAQLADLVGGMGRAGAGKSVFMAEAVEEDRPSRPMFCCWTSCPDCAAAPYDNLR